MRILRSKRLPLLLAVVAAGVLATGAVSAVLFQQTISDTGNVHLRIVKTVASGFDSGWHVHPGIAVVQVQEGSFQIYQGSCTPSTVSAGQTYIEIPHLAVRAIASGRVAWTTTLITSGGDPPQIAVGSYYSDPNYNPCPSLP
jgi:hypothetical protein